MFYFLVNCKFKANFSTNYGQECNEFNFLTVHGSPYKNEKVAARL